MPDLISRQAAIEAVEKAVFKGVAKSAIESLSPVDPKPVCEDCIDRYAVLAELDPQSYEYKVVKELPSVEPGRPKGEWIVKECDSFYGKKYILTCPECQGTVSVTENALPYENFCRECGADMRGEK